MLDEQDGARDSAREHYLSAAALYRRWDALAEAHRASAHGERLTPAGATGD